MTILENDSLLIQVKDKGAELTKIFDKKNRIEHLWQADPNIWGRHAPVLFPIVGQLDGGTYEINNQTFKMSQHGFARDMFFEIKEQFENSVIYEFESSGDTLKVYPYDFKFSIVYTLNDNVLEVRYKIENTDSSTMYFSIGAHPGFTCPFIDGEFFEDYYLEFDVEENLDRILFSDGLLTGEKQRNFITNSKKISLTRALFDDDAIILKDVQSDFVTIKNIHNEHQVKVNIKGFPYLGIWSKPKSEGNFVCIEPWYGVTDTKDANLSFEEKQGRLSLPSGKKFECSFTVQIS